MKSHDSILVPLLGRGVSTAGFAPPRHRPIKCQFRSWSQRGTIRRSTGHIMVTARYSNQRGSKSPKPLPGPTNREHRRRIGVKTMSLETTATTVSTVRRFVFILQLRARISGDVVVVVIFFTLIDQASTIASGSHHVASKFTVLSIFVVFLSSFCFVFMLSLELCRCSSDIFLSSRPHTLPDWQPRIKFASSLGHHPTEGGCAGGD